MGPGRVVLHCNAGGSFGMGHLMRCVALSEAALDRGWTVRIGGDLSAAALGVVDRFVPQAEVEAMALARVPQWLAAARTEHPDVIHVDSYLHESDVALGDFLLSNMQDGAHGVRPADLAVDGNLGAERRHRGDPAGAALLGIRYMPIRRQVTRQRSVAAAHSERLRMLVVLGGTDPFDVTTHVVGSLTALTEPIDATVVAPPSQHEVLASVAADQRHDIRLVEFLDDLPATARQHDVVVSAAGTSVWDFACMGAPSALLCVVDNQHEGYEAAVDAGIALGLGSAPFADLPDRIAELEHVMRDRESREALARRGMATVDGLGARRTVAAWESTR
ncbi:hypothetical protein [Nocardioides sp. YIM 152315]|uniref:PseG/SpsG family protein n=1 Tax=Nocardioides sp. YIM 152315 TaxID=3031760 RepID=UPI0023DB5F5E|nr:hypothetical protein [Nocardioides sp. YIM 152315]MDF1604890.1 hypothetical protein [Nocardioides sp. YIM 152315]